MRKQVKITNILFENTIFSIFDNIKLFSIFLIVKHIFLFFILKNKKLFQKTIVKQCLNFFFFLTI